MHSDAASTDAMVSRPALCAWTSRRWIFSILLVLAGTASPAARVWASDEPAAATSTEPGWLHWKRLPELPATPDQRRALGVAGAFVGVHRGALIVAGGANFPHGPPWAELPGGGSPPKAYHADVYLLPDVAAHLADRPSAESAAGSAAEASAPQVDAHERPSSSPAGVWRVLRNRLPSAHGLAYGVSVSLPYGVLCVGGEWQHTDEAGRRHIRRSRDVFLIAVTADGTDVEVRTSVPTVPKRSRGDIARDDVSDRQRHTAPSAGVALPPLPLATSMAGGTLCGHTVYVVGGQTDEGATDAVWALDLGPRALASGRLQWMRLPDVPHARRGGIGRVLPVVTTQHNGRSRCVYVFSGRCPGPTGLDELLRDAWRFDPVAFSRITRQLHRDHPSGGDVGVPAWHPVSPIRLREDAEARCRMAGVAAPLGANHIVLVGGDDGRVYRRVQHLQSQLQRLDDADDPAAALRRRTLQTKTRELLEQHPGFSRDVLLYNCVTDRWSVGGRHPGSPPVTTTAAVVGGYVVIPSGERRPGVRTPEVWAVRAAPRQPHQFGWTNWGVVAAYLTALVALGGWFARRESSTEDFFLARGRIPWWAAGLSIFATMLSAITYLAIPARAYGSDWVRCVVNFGIPVVAPIVAFCYLPVYRRLRLTSVYEYLEHRFHLGIRLFGSVSFVAFQLGRMAIVVLLPALALSAVTGFDPAWCILLTGVLATLYTVLGGIEAVVWTDVVQAVVLLGGALLSVVLIANHVDGGWATILQDATRYEKLRLAEWHWDWTGDAFAVVVIGALFTNLLPYSSDQSVVQRYLATPTDQAARRALWTNAALSVFATVLFFGLGTVLFSFYHRFPERLPPLSEQDQVFAWFIGSELPAGVAGLVIAGVFAATMSSLDSSMHSVATVLTTDFVQRLGRSRSDRGQLWIARMITCVVGLGGTAGALVLAHAEIRYLFDFFLDTMGLLLGTLGGVFALGIFTRRVHAVHVWPAIVAGVVVLAAVRSMTNLNGLLFGAIAVCTTFATGLALACLMPRGDRAPVELTAYAHTRRSASAGTATTAAESARETA